MDQLDRRATKTIDSISDETDIYGQLGISGADLAEVFDWMAATYATDCSSVTPKHYDINEPPGRWLSAKPYKPVTVAEMLDAVERGHWIVPG